MQYDYFTMTFHLLDQIIIFIKDSIDYVSKEELYPYSPVVVSSRAAPRVQTEVI